MFWCDSQSWRDYQDYGDVIVFDSTYKMNHYGMPFIPFVGVNNHRCTTVFSCAIVSDETEGTYMWLLQTFMKAMSQQKPKSIITDGDVVMIRAIRNVLLEVWHHLCSLHIEKICRCTSIISHWRSSDRCYTTPLLMPILRRDGALLSKNGRRRKHKNGWIGCTGKGNFGPPHICLMAFFLGMRSNQRSESLNSCLHLHLGFGMTIVDLVVHYENCIVRLRENEVRDDCTASQSVPVVVTDYREIEEAASCVFTPTNFYILQEEQKKVEELDIFETLVGIESHKFIVAWKNNHKFRFSVEYTPWNSEETIKCSCRRMVQKGLPCKHILHVLNYLKLSEIPKCCVLKRFSTMARDGCLRSTGEICLARVGQVQGSEQGIES